MSLSRILANIGTALDSATTGDFLSKVDSDGVFGGVAYSSVTGTPTVLDSANITNLVDSAYIQLRQTAVSGGGLDSATTISFVDSDYITSRATASGFQMFEYDATAGQTEFTGSDVNGNTLAYSEYGLLVHYNGILLSGATDYTATDGTTVVLTDSADADARITIAKWSLASAGGGGGAAAAWYGDRGIFSGGRTATVTAQNVIQYIDITTPGNTTDFGDLIAAATTTGATTDGTYGVVSDKNTDLNYITIATLGNATDFGGNLLQNRNSMQTAADGTYGVFGGGLSGTTYDIDYITIASPGNAIAFGDLTVYRNSMNGAVSDGTYGVFGGGNGNVRENTIDYITIATPSNATDFGDLSVGNVGPSGVHDTTYGMWGGGFDGTRLNNIEYVTIATPSNATDFGDLTLARSSGSACNNDTYGVFGGGYDGSNRVNTIDYITIATPSNATDFGDLLDGATGPTGTSGSPS